MKFFTQFATLLAFHNIKLLMAVKGEIMTVTLIPQAKEDISKVDDEPMPPLVLRGTPAELDEKFFEHITTAMEKTGGILTNIRVYAEQMKKKEEAAKEKAAKSAEKKSGTTPAKKEAAKPATKSLFDSGETDTDVEEEPEDDNE
jgi:PRTRC genetic system protein E